MHWHAAKDIMMHWHASASFYLLSSVAHQCIFISLVACQCISTLLAGSKCTGTGSVCSTTRTRREDSTQRARGGAGQDRRFQNPDNVHSTLLCFPTLHFRAPPSHMARALHSHETPFPSLSCCNFSIAPCGQQVVAGHGVNLRCELHTAGLGNKCRNNVQRNPNSPLDITVLSHSWLSRTAHFLPCHITKFRYYTQHKKETIPHPFIPCYVRKTIAMRNF